MPGEIVPSQLVTLGELALLVHLLSRSGAHAAAAERCRAALRAAYDEDDLRQAVVQDKNTALHAWLTVLLGLGDPDAGGEIRRLVTAEPNAFAAERMPHRTLELCWLLGALGWTSPFAPRMEDVYRTTFLGRPHAIETAAPADAYAVTHTVAYVTDFGAQPFFAAESARVAADVRGLLAPALASENYDLVASFRDYAGWAPRRRATTGRRGRISCAGSCPRVGSSACRGMPRC